MLESGHTQLHRQEYMLAKDLLPPLLAPESPRWQLVHGGEGWSHTSLHMCATAMLGQLGDVYLRCVVPFDRFPWRLCQLFHDAVGDRDRRALGAGVVAMQPCCCDPGFTMKLVRRCGTNLDALFDPACLQFLQDYLESNMQYTI